MKNLKFSLIAAAAGFALIGAGCAGTSTPASDSSDDGAAMEQTKGDVLDGAWVITEATGQYADLNKGTTYTFDKAKSTLSTKQGIIVSNGTMSNVTDSTFSVLFEGLSNPFNYTYHFEGGKLVLELATSGGQVFTLERK
ncbi:MAG: hypothetical protein CO030_02265 [Candidatus Magasanikbacteria bacterium CG_4_9_14_0_2_um_filter_42_11]|uniref:DUF306 domain-containing protein n=1 Tax=Candidatus Magasanikbacteria bacterium CG_4_9_14_0_2_um_filter_42_11 TaxID=1974643 RepID=A0A2M8FA11_9BACT|nr:MAG: hypothetical protein COU34_05050 [Candidatus Magasanikbacteria bacterium CG10_big_fil_rev_8_21_14_0_10_43_9]PIY92354.1 MAG: hypothetical protein COY70_03610 [Candidatus Magasanikbacteria bacterium CG_4_10_14_0_8_um_filter_42_12]PJC52557.1 MAG: hypothetical protein CO030_02265 [Candidatus Magasanikbacteria bacterium CG_4_9_14_0_2_um_filter_42_11]